MNKKRRENIMTNILKIENLSKSYDKNLVLKNINLEIEKKQIKI